VAADGRIRLEPVPAGLPAVETAERIRAQGGLVYLQHPFYRIVHGRMRPAAREDLRGRGLIDIVEARNGGPLAAADNARALQWARACGLPHAASSDAHEPGAIGTCVSAVPAAAVSAASLPELLRAATRSTAARRPPWRWRARPPAGRPRRFGCWPAASRPDGAEPRGPAAGTPRGPARR
jgi:predicted metal-dependent phosphoesterase TrpH